MEKRPNILFILSDDQGEWAMGCSGNADIITPNLDLLAEEGTRFDNFFCTSPVCSPARASILTGKIPSRHGVQDWIKGGNSKKDAIRYLDGHRAYTEHLAEAGYICGLSGKWHLGSSYEPQKGFEHWYAHLMGSGNYYNAPMIRNGLLEFEPKYVTDAITDDAIDFIRRHSGGEKPFYLSVHYTAPHDPWVGGNQPEEELALYEDCAFESCPQRDKPYHDAVYLYNREDARESLKGYFAAVTAMDRNIGRLVDTLDELGIREETLVIFTSDNGFNCGHHGIWGKGNGNLSLNMYDSSVKVPFIISQPGTLPEKRLSHQMLSQYDIFPTLLDYAGCEPSKDESLPGRSFLPRLMGGADGESRSVVVYDEYGPCRMIRSLTHKYIHRYPGGPHEFYDLVSDPGEDVNLIDSAEHQPLIEKMRAELHSWFVRYADPAIDGAREPVSGNGQLCRPGIYSGGRVAFAQNRTPTTKPFASVGPKPGEVCDSAEDLNNLYEREKAKAREGRQ